MAKRRREPESSSDYEEHSSSTADSGSDNDSDYDNKPTRRRVKNDRSKTVKELKLSSKASILVLAHIESEQAEQNVLNVDKSVLSRITKALNLANHPGTGEQEAKAALRMANKLMSQHSVTQAAVLATMADTKEKLKKAGMSTVTVRCDEGKTIQVSTWSLTVECAMDALFNCKSYSERFASSQLNRVDFVFYGLAEQTVAAAYAFEMVYNLIMTWRMQNVQAKGMAAKNAYCRGVADGLYAYAREEKRREEREAKEKEQGRLEASRKAEEEERQKQIKRLERQPEEEGEDEEGGDETKPVVKIEEVKVKLECFDDDDSKLGVRDVKEESIVKEEPAEFVDRRPKMEEVEDEYDAAHRSSPITGAFDDHAMGYNSDSPSDSGGSRTAVDPGFDNDDDDDDVDVGVADFSGADEQADLDLERIIDSVVEAVHSSVPVKPEPKPDPTPIVGLKKEEERGEQEQEREELNESPWESAGQLVAFRESATVIADEFLKREKPELKLGKAKPRPSLRLKDDLTENSYKQGKEDSKKIDVKRRRITQEEEDLVY